MDQPTTTSGLKDMEKTKTTWTSRRSPYSRIINEASTLLSNDSATHQQLVSIYERLKTISDEMNKINSELESLIPEEDFQAEHDTIIKYEDNATHILSELLSGQKRI